MTPSLQEGLSCKLKKRVWIVSSLVFVIVIESYVLIKMADKEGSILEKEVIFNKMTVEENSYRKTGSEKNIYPS